MHLHVDSRKLKQNLQLIGSIPGYTDKVVLLTAVHGEDKQSDELLIEGAAAGSFIKLSIPARVVTAGQISIDADYLSSLSLSASVELKNTGSKLHFKSGNLKGELILAQGNKVESARPFKEVETNTLLEKQLLVEGLTRTNIVPSLPNPTHGVHVQVNNNILKVSCNDSFRGCFFTKTLRGSTSSFDAVLKTQVLTSILSKVDDDQVLFGKMGGLFKMLSPTVDFNYPSIQSQDVDDVEGFFTALDYDASLGMAQVVAESFLKDVQSATSIVTGAPGFEIRIELLFEASSIQINVSSAHGSSDVTHGLATGIYTGKGNVDGGKFHAHLSSKYLTEMLTLFGVGSCELHVWKDQIVCKDLSGSYISAMPTISVEE